ncbi:hypothetical protein [Natronolimnohabitans innermongolicus]|uniref:Uncharacterized protein n=1 Tax=Natronolimnohabitans innermongolicus JCM 12255 TaxID=1227499 RepID=L9XGU7_9EURY|nr:hypothetical protein [Natronolimnohabitans innermongolicus]ELY59903.1 hypothetical protein C493_04723 [Natronolimnohabitans innermongolicus JCM 12255]
MDASRFTTLCFVYCGSVLVASQLLVFRPDAVVATLANTSAALCILFTGVYRLYSTDGERKPETYGPLTYAMAVFSLLVTVLFLAGLSLIW